MYTPGGINTSMRSIGIPLAFKRAAGSKLWDADGNEYIDYHLAAGPQILGHCDPKVNARVFETLENLDLVGLGTTEEEAKLAEMICHCVPSAKQALFCLTGSEATYSAIRLARAVTKRTEIIRFIGGYHGWHDSVLAGPSRERSMLGHSSAGMIKEVVSKSHALTFNDLKAVEKKIRERRGKIAAVILEPIMHNVGCVMPKIEFLKGLRELTEKRNIILIFDEMITGFRHGLGGYQKICGITPDVTTLGKSIANGYPLAAICGREDLMQRFKTAGGDVFFAGTYNAHPLSTAAGIATIEALEDGSVYDHIFALGDQMRKGMKEICENLGLRAYATGFGSIFVTYFLEPPVENYTSLLKNDGRLDVAFRREMVKRRFLIMPMDLRRGVISASHSKEEIIETLNAAKAVLERSVSANRRSA